MSYIFIDADEARRCAALIHARAEHLGELLQGEDGAFAQKLEAFRQKLNTLSADLSEETEAYAAADEKLKMLHLMTNEGRRADDGVK